MDLSLGRGSSRMYAELDPPATASRSVPGRALVWIGPSDRVQPGFRFGAAVFDERDAVHELAEPVDRDPHEVAGPPAVGLRRDDRGAREQPRADRQRVRG